MIKIKDFDALIDNKPFFDHPVENKQEAYENLIKMSRNNDYTTENVFDFFYHQNYYKRIGIDLSRQNKYYYWVLLSIPQQTNFKEN